MVGVVEVQTTAAALITHLKPAFLEESQGCEAQHIGAPGRYCNCQLLPSALEKCGRTTTTSCAAAPLPGRGSFVSY